MSEDENGKSLAGKGWTALAVSPHRWLVSIQTEHEVMSSLAAFVAASGIQSGQIGGVGACHKVVLSFRNPETKAYDDTTIEEQMEVTNLAATFSSSATRRSSICTDPLVARICRPAPATSRKSGYAVPARSSSRPTTWS